MAVNPNLGGVARPVDNEIGILWYAEATEDADFLSEVLNALDVSEIEGITEAGAVSTEGFTVESNDADSGDDEILRSWNSSIFDRLPSDDAEEGTSTISFALLEVLNVNAMHLVYRNIVESTTETGMVSEINGTQKPTDKFLIFEYEIKGNIVREVFPNCSFASRESFTLANDALSQHGVSYNIKGDESSNWFKRVFPTA